MLLIAIKLDFHFPIINGGISPVTIRSVVTRKAIPMSRGLGI